MAKGNDGNYFQHSVEISVADHLTTVSRNQTLHIAFTHGMAPFEKCETSSNPPAHRRLRNALDAAKRPSTPNEPRIIEIYRATTASLESYPNSGELLAHLFGRSNLSGCITEVDRHKHAELAERWKRSSVVAVNSSWRRQMDRDGRLVCPPQLGSPWLFSADPMTFSSGTYADDEKIYEKDIPSLTSVLKNYVASGQPGAALLFVYSVRKDTQRLFRSFADTLGAGIDITASIASITHRGGNRNLVAAFFANVPVPKIWLPEGATAER